MPMYEYQCRSCGQVSEVLRRMSDADEPFSCENCGSDETHRAHSVFSAASTTPLQQSDVPPMCGACGGQPGSCAM